MGTDRETTAALEVARQDDGTLTLRLVGDWTIENGLRDRSELAVDLDGARDVRSVAFDSSRLGAWDSSLLTAIDSVLDWAEKRSLPVELAGLPAGVGRLLELARAVRERPPRPGTARGSPLARVGKGAAGAWQGVLAGMTFIGLVAQSFGRLLIGRAQFRRSDFTLAVQESGARALPIVSLISFLVGLILAFVGAVQLRQFGATIFVANGVAIGMAREMGAMMTAIIMAGHTGAAFAAQLGTMTVNEEIDALSTMGIAPVDFLVLPRMLALVLMLPLLCLYSNLLGILGGAVVGIFMLDITPTEYFLQTQSAVEIQDFLLGLIKAAIYGLLVALAGCMRGIQCGRSAAAVGEATTSAVVTSIVAIVVASAILTVIYDVIGV